MVCIASPELRPSAALPWICIAGRPLKRCCSWGPRDQWLLAKLANEAICPLLPRTYHWPMSSGTLR